MISLFQSTRIPRGGATATTSRLFPTFAISIHAPHEGVRQYQYESARCVSYFNPRTPRGGATSAVNDHTSAQSFQSTHPTRGCDKNRKRLGALKKFQSTHPTRGCDGDGHITKAEVADFNPRTPRGGATAALLTARA